MLNDKPTIPNEMKDDELVYPDDSSVARLGLQEEIDDQIVMPTFSVDESPYIIEMELPDESFIDSEIDTSYEPLDDSSSSFDWPIDIDNT